LPCAAAARRQTRDRTKRDRQPNTLEGVRHQCRSRAALASVFGGVSSLITAKYLECLAPLKVPGTSYAVSARAPSRRRHARGSWSGA
jgi:hypothetical protein